MSAIDAYTVALLHANGSDGSSVFTDETGKTWTANGNAQIDTAQSVFGGASGLFDGSGDYISAPDSVDWRLDDGSNSNEWTIDLRVMFAVDPGTGVGPLLQQYQDNSNFWSLNLNNNILYFQVYSGGSSIVLPNNAWNPAATTWYHLALVKQGTVGYKMFIDGTQIGTTQTDTDVIPNFTGALRAGIYTTGSGSSYLNGWLDEIRISKGIARWTSDFTPPVRQYGLFPMSFMF